jgi:ribosome-associated toxin RatA of RatAB toxin-antitoxin module
MELANEILIAGNPDRIFQLAADIQDWPRILPHYRYVNVQDRGETYKVAVMAASRDGFPVKWRARQELQPDSRRIRFLHIGGITRGMDVEWRIEPGPESVHVSIHHSLTYPVPILGPLFAEYIVGRLFVHNIAGKTLRCIKTIAESESAGPSARPGASPSQASAQSHPSEPG